MDGCRLRPLSWAPEHSPRERACRSHEVSTETPLLEKGKWLQAAMETGGRAPLMSPFCIWGSPQSHARAVAVPLGEVA